MSLSQDNQCDGAHKPTIAVGQTSMWPTTNPPDSFIHMHSLARLSRHGILVGRVEKVLPATSGSSLSLKKQKTNGSGTEIQCALILLLSSDIICRVRVKRAPYILDSQPFPAKLVGLVDYCLICIGSFNLMADLCMYVILGV